MWYFTFGQGHTHMRNGIECNVNTVVCVPDESCCAARKRMVAVFGRKWCWQYSDRGLIDQHGIHTYVPIAQLEGDHTMDHES